MADKLDKDIQKAIEHTESSGRPDVIGDVGLKGGHSTGLMQIQRDTAIDMLKKKLLPREWRGETVKKENLTELLKDPEFNRLAGTALFVDNKRRLRKVAANRGGPVSEDMLNDWAIKAHNQGLSKTIDREVTGKSPELPAVNEYLAKVKSKVSGIQKERTQKDMDTRQALTAQGDLGPTPGATGLPASDITPTLDQRPPMPTQEDATMQPEVASAMGYEDGGLVEPWEQDYFPNPEQEDTTKMDDYSVEDEMEDTTIPTQEPVEMDDSGTVASTIVEESEKDDEVDPQPSTVANEEEGPEGTTVTEDDVIEDVGMDKEEAETLAAARKHPSIDIKAEYEALMSEYKSAKEKKDEAKKKRASLKIVDAVSKFSSQYARGQAMEASGINMGKVKAGIDVPKLEDLYEGPDTNVLKDRLALLKQYQAATGKTTKPKYMKSGEDIVELKDGQATMVYEGDPEDKDIKTQVIDMGDKKVLINKNTGEPISNYRVVKAPKVSSTVVEINTPEGDKKVLIDKATGEQIAVLGNISDKQAEARALRAEKSKADQEERVAKRRDRHEKVVMDSVDKLSGLVGARSVYAKALLRHSLVRDGLRVIESIREEGLVPTEQIAEELATVVASALQGGNQATREAIKGIIPHTARGSFNAAKQYVLAKPQEFINEEFLDHFEHQLEGQKDYWGDELTKDQQAQFEKLKIIFDKKDKDGNYINKDLEDMFKRSMAKKTNRDKLEDHDKIQRYADKHFGGNYQHAKKFLKQKGEI